MSARVLWTWLVERFGEDSLRPGFDLFRQFDDPEPSARFLRAVFARELRTDFRVVDANAPIANPQANLIDRLGSASSFVILPPAAPEPAERGAAPTPSPEERNAPPGPVHAPDGDGGITGSIQFGSMGPLQGAGNPAPPFGGGRSTADYVVAYGGNFGPFSDPIVFDALSRTLLTGGPGDWPELGAGPGDVFTLTGDYSAGVTLPDQQSGIDRIVVLGGNDYNLVAEDDLVEAGATMTIDAMPLGADDHIMFDGTAETDGRFEFFGSGGDDFFFGGAGDDRVAGLGGGDSLTGGRGSDIFVYSSAYDSTGLGYDTIADFDPATDRIDLLGRGVAGFADAIEGGSLSYASFNDDLAAAAASLGAAQALWFAPDQGDLAGQIFLIIDGNGQAGYQDGEDFVIAIAGAPLADLTGHTDIFI